MRSIPVDVSMFGGFMCVNAPEIKANPTTGEVRKDVATGLPMYVVGVVALKGKDSSVIQISVPGEPEGMTVGSAVRVVGLEAVPWSVGDRSGVSFRASALVGPAAGETVTAAAGSARRTASGSGVPVQRGGGEAS